MSARPPTHHLHVRTLAGKRLAVAVRPITSADLARRFAEALAQFLAEPDPEFVAAPRFAFAVRDVLEAAGADLESCTVEVVARTVTHAGKRSRVVGRLAVAGHAKLDVAR